MDPEPHVGVVIREHDTTQLVAPKALPPTEQPGQIIGAYTLIELLGEGGFGAVWLAEQTEPVKRQVALKILKAGMDTQEVMARFAQERQALAVMDHPNIARVLDAGTTPLGRPFFVMELVRGVMITRYCDEKRLTTPERLRLFIQVCLAVQHAHQKGIIHRDVKPTNILVTEHDRRAQVKVIDFGIAKATCAESLTKLTIITQLNRLVGTPAYVSPEQIIGAQDVDTRADIYSLGVVLYELLTGRTPFRAAELAAAGHDGMLLMLFERPAPKPSSRVRTLKAAKLQAIADARHIKPPELLSLLCGDLDWIVMKALEKERDRRYDTANALRDDVERFLKQSPILARPPSSLYSLRQFTRRNRIAVTGAAAVLLAILLGLAISTHLFFREREARAAATAEAEKSRQVSAFLQDTLASAGVSKSLGRDATMMKEVLDDTEKRISSELANRPRVEAELRLVIGRAYEDLNEYPKAIEQQERALELQRQLHDGDHPDLARTLMALGSAIEFQGQPLDAEPHVREALTILQHLHAPDDPAVGEAHILLAWIYLKSGRSALGAASAKLGYDIWLEHPEDRRLEGAPKTHAAILAKLKRPGESEAIYREELATWRRILGPDHPTIANCLDNFGITLVRNGKFREAEPILKEALAQGRKFFGDRSPHEDHVLAGLAAIAARRGDLETQLKLLRDGVAVTRRMLTPGHRYRKEALNHLIKALQEQAQKFAADAVKGKSADATAKARARIAELEELSRSQTEVTVAVPTLKL